MSEKIKEVKLSLIEKIDLKLQELGVIKKVETKLAEETEPVSGDTETELETGHIVSTIEISYTKLGEKVIQVVEEGADEILIGDGEYKLDDDTVIVIKDGLLSELTPKEETEEETELDDEVKLASIEKNRISDIVDLTKDGDYTINLEVYDGEITWGSLYTSTWENLLLAEETKTTEAVDELTLAFETKIKLAETKLSDEAEKYENIIEALKSGETKLKEEIKSDVKLSKIDILKLELAENRKNR